MIAAMKLDNTLTGNTLSDSLNATEGMASALDSVLADMEKTIIAANFAVIDNAAALALQAEAVELLSPELRKLAEELGLFGLKAEEVTEMLQVGLSGIRGDETFEQRAAREKREATREGDRRQGILPEQIADREYRRRNDQRLDAIDARNAASTAETAAAMQVMVIIDGESVATATARAASEGAG